MNRLLLVEGQPLVNGLAANLEAEGYEVTRTMRGESGLSLALTHNPDLIVLDVVLNGMNGLDVCRELRSRGFENPIIFVSAKSEEIDRVIGLEIGADDYVTKPIGVRELLARIRVRLRRRPATRRTPTQYSFGNIQIDFAEMRTTHNGKALDLTSKEYALLAIFVRHKGEVLSRERILNDGWGEDCHVTLRTVDHHILKLRQKLEQTPSKPRFFLTVYGAGYRFVG